MNEKWEHWEPIPGLSGRYNFESLEENIHGFKIIFFDVKNSKIKLQIFFEHSIDVYRRTEERYRLATFSKLGEEYEKGSFGNWTFFKVANSEYLKWLSDQSFTLSDYFSLMHFAFIEDDSIIDVVASYEPKVELITGDEFDGKITKLEAFKAMQLFLEKYYERTHSDDVGSLLGDLQLLHNCEIADPAAWLDWMSSIEDIKKSRQLWKINSFQKEN